MTTGLADLARSCTPEELQAKIDQVTEGWSEQQKNALYQRLKREARRSRISREYPSAGALACYVDPTTKQTPALTVIDQALERAFTVRGSRTVITMPPQEGKSTRVTVWGSLRALQLDPDRRIVAVSFAESLIAEHSRTARNIIAEHGSEARDPITGLAMPDKLGLALADDKSAAHHWAVQGHSGGMYSAGIHGGVTGRPADLLIIDDPFSGMEEADSATMRAKVITFWQSTARTRLAAGAPVILVQCMTGDTPVLMADGTETPLRDVRPGDRVATYDKGKIITSTVRNWANQGPDSLYMIRMKSGRTVRANARHPFLLLSKDGLEEWQQTSALRPGDRMVIADGPMSNVPSKNADAPRNARACACRITTNSDGLMVSVPRRAIPSRDALPTSNTDTGSPRSSTTPYSSNRGGSALAAEAPAAVPITGPHPSASTTTMTPAESEDCYATPAISPLSSPPTCSECLPTTWTTGTDEVIDVVRAGTEDVFDVQIDSTENFIANGLVSHNTRWHEKDLAGHLLALDKLRPAGERRWNVVNIPAVSDGKTPDALGRPPGVFMESARGRTVDDWSETREDVGPRTWAALYQGVPTPIGGGLFSTDWFDRHRLQSAEGAVYRLISIDPAETGKRDEAGLLALASTSDGRVLVTDDRSGRMTSDVWARRAVLLALEVGATEIMFEAYTTEQTYTRTIRQAWSEIRDQARLLRRHLGDISAAAAELATWPDHPADTLEAIAELAELRIPDQDQIPFLIHPHRGKGDKVARSIGARQAASTGRLRMVGTHPELETQAATWQVGQDSPDRVDALCNGYNRLMELIGQPSSIAVPGGQAGGDEDPNAIDLLGGFDGGSISLSDQA